MNTTTMRQVFVARLNDVTVVDSPIPVPGEGEVRVAVTLAGICGSDTHAIAGHHPLLQPPYYPGHELVGIVDECGAGVVHLKPGQRVMVKPNVECGTCVNCQAGRTNACQTLQRIGCDPSGVQPGGMAEFVVAPVAHVFAIPEGISDNDSALLEPLATPVHVVRIAGDMEGANVVVLGAGHDCGRSPTRRRHPAPLGPGLGAAHPGARRTTPPTTSRRPSTSRPRAWFLVKRSSATATASRTPWRRSPSPPRAWRGRS